MVIRGSGCGDHRRATRGSIAFHHVNSPRVGSRRRGNGLDADFLPVQRDHQMVMWDRPVVGLLGRPDHTGAIRALDRVELALGVAPDPHGVSSGPTYGAYEDYRQWAGSLKSIRPLLLALRPPVLGPIPHVVAIPQTRSTRSGGEDSGTGCDFDRPLVFMESTNEHVYYFHEIDFDVGHWATLRSDEFLQGTLSRPRVTRQHSDR
jgi:hypothetical protein